MTKENVNQLLMSLSGKIPEDKTILLKQKLEALNINAGTIANYENEIREAPYEYLVLFANYFDVSIDYLLGKEPKEEIANPLSGALTSNERQLISSYRMLNNKAKERVSEYIELLDHFPLVILLIWTFLLSLPSRQSLYFNYTKHWKKMV